MGGGGGGRGNFLTALKKLSAREGVNNYKEKWKVVASKATTLTVQDLFLRGVKNGENKAITTKKKKKKFYSPSTAIRAVKV